MRPTIFRTPLNAEHVQVCELAVIKTATADSCTSGTATGSVFFDKTQVKLLNKEFKTKINKKLKIRFKLYYQAS